MWKQFARGLLSTFSKAHTPRVAIVGSGPAGLYACSRLLERLPSCSVDVFDKNQVPYGLICYGVAPDHLDIKKCVRQFARMFNANSDRLSLFCDVSIGKELSYEELCDAYDAVILAYGATKARKLRLPNENAINCFTGIDFVSWYNGKPVKTPLLDQREAVIIGHGNVAIDCARILLRSTARLATCDIPEYALAALRRSAVRNVRIFGRRGPNEASFTIKELRELLYMDNSTNMCDIPGDYLAKLEEEKEAAVNRNDRARRRLLELMIKRRIPRSPGYERGCSVEFWHKPTAINVDASGRVSSVEFLNSRTNEAVVVPCGLLICSLGFETYLLDGVPKTEEGKLKMLDWCRVAEQRSSVYATGWCAGVARGVIADSQNQAYAVVDEVAQDWENGRTVKKTKKAEGIKGLLDERHIPYITFDDWKYIDECERKAGAALGKPREKLLDYKSILQAREKDGA